MPRRRPSLRDYVRRRWRAVGLVLVLLAASLLLVAVTDRGHDPVWDARAPEVDQLVASPDGGNVYALVAEDGNLTRLEARSGEDGRLLWESPLRATRALLQAGPDGVAVATDFPSAFLTYFGEDGSVRYQIPVEGNPRAMAIEGGRLALAVQGNGYTVLVLDDGRVVDAHRFSTIVNALDMRAGRLAIGTDTGGVLVHDHDGALVSNLSFPFSVRTMRLSAEGRALVLGGFSLMPNDVSGAVAYVDLDEQAPLRWTRSMSARVGLVDMDAAGTRVLVVEESPPRYSVTLLEATEGTTRWSRTLQGHVGRDDAGAFGGAALAPDGRTAAFATLRGAIRLVDATDGEDRWTFGSKGSTLVTYPRERPDLLLANGRLVPNGENDVAFLFSTGEEPTYGRLPVLALTALATATVSLALFLGIGYWRLRRTY